jgi:hypothetical protein
MLDAKKDSTVIERFMADRVTGQVAVWLAFVVEKFKGRKKSKTGFKER